VSWLLVAAAAIAVFVAAPRWLRVAQREHYLPGSSLRFAVRWWRLTPWNPVLLAVAVVAVAVATRYPIAGLGAAAVALIGPMGLGIRGRTAPLAWTPRLRRLAMVSALPALAGLVAGARRPAVAAAVPLLVPVVVDLASTLLGPVESRLGSRWVVAAADRLAAVGPTVVAITGSFGKTTTKTYVAHLLGGVRSVLASPASFNNRMGLARAVNEHLAPGTDVFVVEMGTYGPGEIRDLCDWIPPDVAVITAIGPVHLERMGSEDRIAAAKREILERAPVAVLNVDHPRLAAIADDEVARRRVVRCSIVDDSADVAVLGDGRVVAGGIDVGTTEAREAAERSNLACALGAVVGAGIDPAAVAGRLTSPPAVAHRRAVGRSERGVTIIDDTYNSNPAGTRAALEVLAGSGDTGGRRVVVTPGMVELGHRQAEENQAFAAAAAEVASHLVVVGRTNRRALLAGTAGTGAEVIVVPSRAAAVDWARGHLGPGDAVLYENDLPDHYP
jgi:UDP-N-acetylmuramoyl-tripeptide--D-alanyl-D-alanine ligase